MDFTSTQIWNGFIQFSTVCRWSSILGIQRAKLRLGDSCGRCWVDEILTRVILFLLWTRLQQFQRSVIHQIETFVEWEQIKVHRRYSKETHSCSWSALDYSDRWSGCNLCIERSSRYSSRNQSSTSFGSVWTEKADRWSHRFARIWKEFNNYAMN